MIENPTDYEALTEQLEAIGLDYTVAEMHGIACGMLCSMTDKFQALWHDTLFAEIDTNDVLAGEARKALDKMVDITRSQLNDSELALSLVLPADDTPVVHRMTAVRDWSQGFLYGFGLAGKQENNLLSADAGEALRDLVEISRVDTEQLEEAEQDEDALYQLSEYLWVAALLIRQDVLQGKQESTT